MSMHYKKFNTMVGFYLASDMFIDTPKLLLDVG